MTNKMNYLGGTDWENGDVLDATDLINTIKQSSLFSNPIGSIIARHKDFTNTPALPGVWVECNGQTLSDAESPYNGQVIPDLNGGNRFLRGNSESGGIGGAETHQHITPIGRRTSTTIGFAEIYGTTGIVNNFINYTERDGNSNANITATNTSSTDTKPPFMEVVWIMRVK